MDNNNEIKKEFVCKKCGCCCKNIGVYEPAEFLDRGDGVCKYFDEKTNLCTIYDFRPDFCRVDKMYKQYKDKMTWNQYVDANYEGCEELRKMEKIKEFKRVYPGKLRYYLEDGEFNDTLKEIEEIEKKNEDKIKNDWYQNKVVINKTDEDEDYLYDDDEILGDE